MKKIQHVFKHQHFIEADKTLVQHSYFYKLKRRTHCHKYLQNLRTVLLSIKAGVPILFFPVLLPLKIKQCKASPNDFTAETTTAKTYSHSQRNILTASRARLERDWVSCAWKHKPGIYIPPWWNNRGIDSTDGDSQGSQAVSLINWFMFLIFRSYFSVGKEAEFRFGAFALKFEPIWDNRASVCDMSQLRHCELHTCRVISSMLVKTTMN